MSEAARVQSGWRSHPAYPETVGAMANTAAAAELAIRAAVGAVGVRAAATMVRDHPLLSMLLACGVGYLICSGQRMRRARNPSGVANAAAE